MLRASARNVLQAIQDGDIECSSAPANSDTIGLRWLYPQNAKDWQPHQSVNASPSGREQVTQGGAATARIETQLQSDV